MKSNRSKRMKSEIARIEPLDQRRMFSTTTVVSLDSYGTIVTSLGTSATAEASGTSGGLMYFADAENPHNTATMHVTNLPNHTMMRVFYNFDFEGDQGDSGTITFTAGPETQTFSFDSGGPTDDDGLSNGRWFATSSSSIDITFDEQGRGLNVGGPMVEIYNPTVSISGGGMTDELDATPTGFTVSRDAPDGYNSTYDEAIPAVDVQLDTPTGSATSGTDYETLPTHVSIPASTATEGSAVVPLVPKDDDVAEGIEDIFLPLKEAAANSPSPYILAAIPATAPATNAATAKASIDDNVSVKSFTVTLLGPTGGPWAHINTVSHVGFVAQIDIHGEHVDKLQFQQLLNAEATITGFDGVSNQPQGNVMENSNGWVQDPSTEGQDVAWHQVVSQDALNSHGSFIDTHDFEMNVISGTYNGNPTIATNLVQIARYMRDSLRDGSVGAAPTILRTLNWGYKWSNWNTIWGPGDAQPLPTGYVELACDQKDTGKGFFSNVQTIDGLNF